MTAEVVGPRENAPLKERIPRPHFHGMLVTPETVGTLPNGEKATATFNAALVAIPRQRSSQSDLIAVYRVNLAGHVPGEPDKTNYFGIQKLRVAEDGLSKGPVRFEKADSFVAPEDVGKNPEDMRLIFDSKIKKVVGGLTEAMSLPKLDGSKEAVPMIASIEAKPVYNFFTGRVGKLQFSPADLTKQLVNGEAQPFTGKNVQVEFDADGTHLLRYRPEYEGDIQWAEENKTHFRTLKKGQDGYWAQYREEGVYDTDLSALLPEGNTLRKFGLNGRQIDLPNGKSFRVDHACSTTPDGITEYQFITVDGKIKPLLSFDDAISLSGQTGTDLIGDKRVIYCNGATVMDVPIKNGTEKRLVMAVTLFDKSIAIFSYNLEELGAYATEDTGPSISTRDKRLG